MGIELSSDFSPRIKRLIDDRMSVKTLNELKTLNDNIIPPGLIVFCEEDGVSYRRTLVEHTGNAEADFDILWIALGAGGKIETPVISNVDCGGYKPGDSVAANTSISTFVSHLLFDDRDPYFDYSVSCEKVNNIVMSSNIIRDPVVKLTMGDEGGLTQIKNIVFKDRFDNTLKTSTISEGLMATEEQLTCATSGINIQPSGGDYEFTILVSYDKTREVDCMQRISAAIKFRWPMFRGIADAIPAREADIKQLQAITIDNEFPNGNSYKDSITCDNQYDIIAIPTTMPGIVKIKDQNGFDITDSYSSFVLTISSNDLVVNQQYNIYYSKEPQTIVNFTKVFYTEDPTA